MSAGYPVFISYMHMFSDGISQYLCGYQKQKTEEREDLNLLITQEFLKLEFLFGSTEGRVE